MGVTSLCLDEAFRIRILVDSWRSSNFSFLSDDDYLTLSCIFSISFIWAWMEVDKANVEDNEVVGRLDCAEELVGSSKIPRLERSSCQSIATSSAVLSKFASSSKRLQASQRNCRMHPLSTQESLFAIGFSRSKVNLAVINSWKRNLGQLLLVSIVTLVKNGCNIAKGAPGSFPLVLNWIPENFDFILDSLDVWN